LCAKSQAARDLIVAVERLLSGDTFFRRELDAQSEGKKSFKAPNSGVLLRRGFCFA